jgi:UDPglucose--hexose-1-phosphate uridylyltransferase
VSQFRQNPITKQWVLIAPNRAKRPEDYKTYAVMHGQSEVDHNCVFCPGHEAENEELYTYPNKGAWQLRGIVNKFHALSHVSVYAHPHFYASQAGIGEQEVIITRKHNEPVALQSLILIEDTISLFVERLQHFRLQPDIQYAQVFHNHGRDAGASLVHPHYQILATNLLPPHIYSEMTGCYQYYHVHNACAYCEIVAEELKLKERVVFEEEHFVVISAYASRSPFETWVIPKRHSARFEDMTKQEQVSLAYVLKTVLGKLYMKLDDPSLNFYTHTLPVKETIKVNDTEATYHWHLTVFPRLTIWAGFEYATGIPINPMPPEDTAKFLKD